MAHLAHFYTGGLRAAPIGLLLLLLGCAPSRLGVPGLTLPPGAVVISRVDSKRSSGDGGAAPVQLPSGKQPRQSLKVVFDSDEPIEQIAAHFEQCLLKQGFQDKSQDYLQRHPDASAEMREVIKGMRTYKRPGKQGMVALSDHTYQLAERGDDPAVAKASGKAHRYELWVYGM
jgi:hypothetical protein